MNPILLKLVLGVGMPVSKASHEFKLFRFLRRALLFSPYSSFPETACDFTMGMVMYDA
jgi:hypothetical protein